MSIHKGHRDRMKEKYLKVGINCFVDHELLEVLLYYCYPRVDTNRIAHEILDEYKSLTALFQSDPEDIIRRTGVTKNVAVYISLISQTAERFLQDKWKQEYKVIDSNKIASDFLFALFLTKANECFFMLLLDAKNNIIAAPLVQEGTIDRVHFYFRNVLELIFKYRAVSVILAHNHPSGNLRPSKEDILITREFLKNLKIIDVTLMDHIIVTGNQSYSFEAAGLLKALMENENTSEEDLLNVKSISDQL
ncbi:MAG: DNA repair protein RadC [Defluviitaleaceae bacterium]|nr:DNA repair protein RadC [Defluviitaleaceae bacterium]